jgi:hypothetical protein
MSKRRMGPVLAIAAAVFAMMPGLMVMPVASADTLSNGLTSSCNQDSDIHATCIIGGCPRVNGDYVVDALHYKYDSGGDQQEVAFKCINGQTARVGSPFNEPSLHFGVQACRKKDLEGDWCTPWAHVDYVAPAKAAPPPPVVQAPPPVVQAPPPVVVPDPPKVAPTNAVTMNISVSIPNSTIDIASSADIAGNCTYSATAPLLPSVNKSFALAPNGSTSFTTLSPPLLSTYHVVLSCKGPFDGKTVEYGHVEQNVTAAG